MCLLASTRWAACQLTFFTWRKAISRSAVPNPLAFADWCRRTQPQRDMRGLHRLLHDSQQLIAQLIQVYLLPQGDAESCHRLGGVILAAVEAPVNDPLDALAERLEQDIDRQGGDDDGDPIVLADDATQKHLQANDQAHIDPRQDNRERAIHDRTTNEDID